MDPSPFTSLTPADFRETAEASPKASTGKSGIDQELMTRVLEAVLEDGQGRPTTELVANIIATYEFIQKTGKVNRIREIVRMGFS